MRLMYLWMAALIVPMTGSVASEPAGAAPPADTLITDARIYTADPQRRLVQALAIRGGRILYAGSADGAAAFRGPTTRELRYQGRLIVPGLIDAHVHPSGVVQLDVCDFRMRILTLAQISDEAARCLARYRPAPGEWMTIENWNSDAGNQHDARFANPRAALDAVSRTVPIQMYDSNGHRSGFNSAALARARNRAGKPVGLSRATLRTDFRSLQHLVGVDANGEPDGIVMEDARDVMDSPDPTVADLALLMKAPQRMLEVFNHDGITAVQEAAAPPGLFPLYETLERNGQLTLRVNIAQYYNPKKFTDAAGAVDYGRMIDLARKGRERFAHSQLIRADAIKVFADGVIEGDPMARPPTLPEGASLTPFRQPRFALDAGNRLIVEGYVDTASALCAGVRAQWARYDKPAAQRKFQREHGFHPLQCRISNGHLQDPREVIMRYIELAHRAGFTIHVHVIGDRAVQTAIDAIEAARASDGVTTRPDTLAHLQFVSPADIERIGRDRLYAAFTYSWATWEYEYNMRVFPFLEPGAEDRMYPVRSVQRAGGILVAGSDAPVADRDPIPFRNMAIAVTRALPGQQPLNLRESIGIRDVLDAYTINGAHALARASEIGSLEPGKSADFAVLDRDILELADSGRAAEIADTKVMQTWFQGRMVYEKSAP